MISKDITYTNFDNETVTKTFWFNYSLYEIAAMQMRTEKVTKMLDEISEAKTGADIVDLFEFLVGGSHGLRDGDDFDKSEQISTRFLRSPALSVMFEEFILNSGRFAEFVTALFPPEMFEKINEASEKADGAIGDRLHSDAELLAMSDEEFAAIAGLKMKRMSARHKALAYRRKIGAIPATVTA